MPKSPATLTKMNLSMDINDLLDCYEFEWKQSLSKNIKNRFKMQDKDFDDSENSIPNNRLFQK